jgi:hypothetical protein
VFEHIKDSVVTANLVDDKIEFAIAKNITAKVGPDGMITVE